MTMRMWGSAVLPPVTSLIRSCAVELGLPFSPRPGAPPKALPLRDVPDALLYGMIQVVHG